MKSGNRNLSTLRLVVIAIGIQYNLCTLLHIFYYPCNILLAYYIELFALHSMHSIESLDPIHWIICILSILFYSVHLTIVEIHCWHIDQSSDHPYYGPSCLFCTIRQIWALSSRYRKSTQNLVPWSSLWSFTKSFSASFCNNPGCLIPYRPCLSSSVPL